LNEGSKSALPRDLKNRSKGYHPGGPGGKPHFNLSATKKDEGGGAVMTGSYAGTGKKK